MRSISYFKYIYPIKIFAHLIIYWFTEDSMNLNSEKKEAYDNFIMKIENNKNKIQ